jgi:probable F420-dependent oxidoreductase
VQLGVTIFSTDRTMHPGVLAKAAEERGFASLYFPEHTHMPAMLADSAEAVTARADTSYRRTLDPWVAMSVAAAQSVRLRVGTGVCLVAQHDPITLAKTVATLDHLSRGRVVFGIGYGWSRTEAANHGVAWSKRRSVAREHVLAMQALWQNELASFDGTYVSFPESYSWPKPWRQARVPTYLGGAPSAQLFEHIAEFGDGWLPFGGAGVAASMGSLREAFERVGRDPGHARVIPFGSTGGAAKLEYFAGLGIDEVVLRLPPGDADEVARAMDDYAPLVERWS